MATDITPALAAGRQIIHGYGDGGFRISDQRYQGAVLVTPLQTVTWQAGNETPKLSDYSESSFAPLWDIHKTDLGRVELLIIGTGATTQLLMPELRACFRAQGVGVDVMDTGAACRTYNVLLLEDRRVAAALLAIGTAPNSNPQN